MKRQLLVLSMTNSCRSQVASAVVNYKMGERWQAYSAGLMPAAYVHPLTVEVLAEIGIVGSGLRPIPVDAFRKQSFDLVITTGEDAARHLPAWIKSTRRAHLHIADPVQVIGDAYEAMIVFRRVRDQLSRQVLQIVNQFDALNLPDTAVMDVQRRGTRGSTLQTTS